MENELRRQLQVSETTAEEDDQQDLGDFMGTWFLAIILSSAFICVSICVVVAEKKYLERQAERIREKTQRRRELAMRKKQRGKESENQQMPVLSLE